MSGLESLKVNASSAQRVTLGRSDGDLVASAVHRPVLVFGPQRSGKTTGLVIPTLLDWDGPAVVTSVRTDVVEATLNRRRSVGEVFIYEPTGNLPIDGSVIGWNPLDDCRTWDGALATGKALTEAGALKMHEGEFWYGLASQLLAPLLYAAGSNGYRMDDVVRWVKTQEEFEVRSLLQAAGDDTAANAFESVVGLESRIRSSIYGTLMSVLSVYDYDSVRQSTQISFSLDRFFDGGSHTLYICAPPDEQELFAPLFTALLRRIIREAYKRFNHTRLSSNLLLLLDEAGNIAPLASLNVLATTAAGTGIQLVSIFHDLAQMISIYGEARAQSICNNHSALILMPGSRDPYTTKLVGDLVGNDFIPGLGGGGGEAPPALRRMEPGSALCIYEHLAPELIKLRSSFRDSDLRSLTSTPVSHVDDGRIIKFGRRRHPNHGPDSTSSEREKASRDEEQLPPADQEIIETLGLHIPARPRGNVS